MTGELPECHDFDSFTGCRKEILFYFFHLLTFIVRLALSVVKGVEYSPPFMVKKTAAAVAATVRHHYGV